jgi:hypothetical protein
MSDFSAAPSVLGYVYQLELALLGYLRRDESALVIGLQ